MIGLLGPSMRRTDHGRSLDNSLITRLIFCQNFAFLRSKFVKTFQFLGLNFLMKRSKFVNILALG